MMSEFNNAIESGGGNLVEKEAMPAEFGLAMATFLVVASMVGAGFLRPSGSAVAGCGSNQWMLFLWVVGGITAVCGALTLAELSAALPRTGGDYVYLYEAYGPLPAFLSGWVSFLIGFAGPSAAAAFRSAKYLLQPLEDPRTGSIPAAVSWPGVREPALRVEAIGPGVVLLQRILATALILVFALIHVGGRRQTAQVQGWITVVKLVILGGLAVIGLAVGWPRAANLNDL